MPDAFLVRGRSAPSLIGLLVANLIPFVGVVWFGWDLALVMVLYWAENLVVGAFGVLRITLAGGLGPWWATAGRALAAAFFTVHFGFFCFVHGVFVAVLFVGGVISGAPAASVDPGFPSVLGLLSLVPLGALGGLAISHGLAFGVDYLASGAFREATIQDEMGRPYRRVLVLHVVLIAGGFLMLVADGPVWALGLLVVLKTATDLHAYLRTRGAAPAAEPGPADVGAALR